MTVTYLSAGTPAARRATARPVASAVRAAVVVVLAAVLQVQSAGPVHAEATPSPSPTDLSGETTLTLAPTGNGVLTAGEPLSVWLTVDNDTGRPLPESDATLSLGGERITDRAALSAWLSGDTAVDDVDQVATATVAAVASGDTASTPMRVEPDAAALQNRAPGVYPLLARTSGSAGSLSSRSVITVPGTSAAPPVGIVVPISARPLSEGLLTSDELAGLTAADGLLTGALDAVAGTPAILAIDPAVPAAIRVLGSSAPETATLWLERLLRLPNDRFALQFGDADVAAQLAAGAPAPLQPSSLQAYTDVANFADAAAPTTPEPTPAATDAPAWPALPDLQALLDIGATRSDVYWPLGGTASSEVVAALGTSTGGDVPVTLLPSATTDAGDNAVAAAQRASDAALLVYDSGVSEALRDAAVLPDVVTRGAPLTAAAAYLSFAAGATGPMLTVIERADEYSRVGLRAAITAVAPAPDASPVTLAQLTQATPGTISIVDVETDQDRVTAASRLLADEQTLGTFSSILDDPALLLGPERAEILQLLGAGWATDAASWSVAVETHRTESAATLDAVGILPPTTTNLITSGTDLGFWVRNDLPWPVNVQLNADPDDVRLEVETMTDVRADASSNERVEVPVRARRGNGEVTIALQLRSPSGVPIGGGQQVDVNVRADWEGVGIAILSVLVAGFIVLGLVRTVLHRRWLKRQADAALVAQTDAT